MRNFLLIRKPRNPTPLSMVKAIDTWQNVTLAIYIIYIIYINFFLITYLGLQE